MIDFTGLISSISIYWQLFKTILEWYKSPYFANTIHLNLDEFRTQLQENQDLNAIHATVQWYN